MRNPGTTSLVAFAVLLATSLMLDGCHRGSADGKPAEAGASTAAPAGGGPGAGKRGRRGGGDEGPVPVVATTVQKQDMAVYLDGLGTVQAYNTATVRAQVSGQLIAVPFKEGDEVKAGDVIARIDPRSFQATLDQGLAKLAQDKATLHSAELDLKRYLDLVPQGYVSQQQVDQQRATVEQTRALIQSDEAAIAASRVQLSYCTITAPISGVLGIRQVDVGNLVSANDSTGIVTITQVKPISVTFTLPEQLLTRVRATEVKGMTVIAVGRENRAELARGELQALDNSIDQTTGTIKLKAMFTNTDHRLWPGQFVNVRLLVETRKDALTVPAAALQLGPKGSYVYVIDQDNKAQMREVTSTQSEGGVALIDQGLSEGERVITDGQSRLTPGATVRTGDAKPAAAPAESPQGKSEAQK